MRITLTADMLNFAKGHTGYMSFRFEDLASELEGTCIASVDSLLEEYFVLSNCWKFLRACLFACNLS